MAISREQALAKKSEVPDFNSLREFEINKYLLQGYRGIPLAIPEAMIGSTPRGNEHHSSAIPQGRLEVHEVQRRSRGLYTF